MTLLIKILRTFSFVFLVPHCALATGGELAEKQKALVESSNCNMIFLEGIWRNQWGRLIRVKQHSCEHISFNKIHIPGNIEEVEDFNNPFVLDMKFDGSSYKIIQQAMNNANQQYLPVFKKLVTEASFSGFVRTERGRPNLFGSLSFPIYRTNFNLEDGDTELELKWSFKITYEFHPDWEAPGGDKPFYTKHRVNPYISNTRNTSTVFNPNKIKIYTQSFGISSIEDIKRIDGKSVDNLSDVAVEYFRKGVNWGLGLGFVRQSLYEELKYIGPNLEALTPCQLVNHWPRNCETHKDSSDE